MTRAATGKQGVSSRNDTPMPGLLAALDAFLQEHRRCGELDGGIEGERVWMACDCGAGIVQPVENDAPDR